MGVCHLCGGLEPLGYSDATEVDMMLIDAQNTLGRLSERLREWERRGHPVPAVYYFRLDLRAMQRDLNAVRERIYDLGSYRHMPDDVPF